MAITRFRPEIWAALLLASLEKNLVYAGPGIANRNYEGEIKGQGSTVRITSVGDVDVHDYVPGTPLERQTLTDAQSEETAQGEWFVVSLNVKNIGDGAQLMTSGDQRRSMLKIRSSVIRRWQRLG